jgi:very-short-patch-repair endonuclease
LPRLVDLIEQGEFSIENIHGASGLLQAIFHKNAAQQLQSEWDTSDAANFEQQLKTCETKERQIIGELASKKAWLKTIALIEGQAGLIGHLNAWLNFIGNIPQNPNSQNYNHFVNLARNAMKNCKEAIPCWIMPLYQVVEQFDPKPGLFDLIIVDEASQLAVDAILLYYLGKKIIVVGDNKQTAPEFVGTNQGKVHQLMNTHLPNDLPQRGHYHTNFSFFDHCSTFTQQQIILREHFRCMPEIIEFSNRNFYNGNLFPLKQYSAKRLEPLKTVFCGNGYVEGLNENIRNQPEAEQMVETIATLIEDESYRGKTMGVITLQGRQQANLIEHLLLQKIGVEEFQKRKIVCGHSASFQGDERDIMFLSLVTAHNHNTIALTSDNYQRRYNVAASRAKEQSWLFHSVNPEDLNPNDLRYKLLDHYKNYKLVQEGSNAPIFRKKGTFPPPQPFGSWFEVDVYNEILRENKNLNLVPQYKVAGERYRIDLVALFPNGAKLAIECDGEYWHGPEQWESDRRRQRTLENVGWVFFRVRDWQFYHDKTLALRPFWDIVTNLQN